MLIKINAETGEPNPSATKIRIFLQQRSASSSKSNKSTLKWARKKKKWKRSKKCIKTALCGPFKATNNVHLLIPVWPVRQQEIRLLLNITPRNIKWGKMTSVYYSTTRKTHLETRMKWLQLASVRCREKCWKRYSQIIKTFSSRMPALRKKKRLWSQKQSNSTLGCHYK